MRNLDECRQEIFLRSGQRIARRRKIRRGIIAGCIPVILCTAVLVSGLLPKSNEKSGELRTESVPITSGMGGIQVHFPGAGHPETVADPEKAAALSTRLAAYFAVPEQETATEPPHAPESATPPPENHATPTPIRITCYTPEGREIRYTLSGLTLTEAATGNTVTLTEAEKAELEALIQKP